MTMLDAVNHVCSWLKACNIAFTPLHVEQAEDGRQFRVTVIQVLPAPNKQRIFDVMMTDVPDCWNVVEVA